MNILQQIISDKHVEVTERKNLYPLELLKKSKHFDAPTVSLKNYLLNPSKNGIIAEFKRKSPSKPNINLYADPEEITIGYMQSGASALSVLTDYKYFGGSNRDLEIARNFNLCPILRKDFIIDPYQIYESKSIGADAILLIAEVLTLSQIKDLTQLAHELHLEVLLELHDETEIKKTAVNVDVIGVNNRNLKTFKTDFQRSIDLLNKLPKSAVKIAESGIQTPDEYTFLLQHGFQGALIGETFMKTTNPGIACKSYKRKEIVSC